MSFKISRVEPSLLTNLSIKGKLTIPIYSHLPDIQNAGSIIYDMSTNCLYMSNGAMWLELVSKYNISPVDNFVVDENLVIPKYNTIPPVQNEGSLIYVIAFNGLYISDGVSWIAVGSNYTLPSSLQSIANLSTTGNEMIYTVATDTYNKTSITSFGRNLVASSSQSSAQGILGTVVGIDVQEHAGALDTFNSIASTTSGDKIIYNTGLGTFTNTVFTPVARTLLDDTSINEMRDTLDVVQRGLASTNNAVALFDGGSGDKIKSSDVFINGNDVLNVANIDFSGNINNVTAVELSQLETIDATVLPSVAWSNMSTMNQGVATTSSPSFSGLALTNNLDMSSNRIVNLASPTSSSDATNKLYVDTVAGTGFFPLTQSDYATATILPNAPTYAEPSDAVQTLTSTAGAGVQLVVDGVSVANGKRILVKDQADTKQNGIYDVTDNGAGVSVWILTRSSDFNQAKIVSSGTIVKNSLIFIKSGGVANSNTSWVLQADVTQIRPTAGGSAVSWVQFAGSQNITPNDGLIQSGTDWNIDATSRFTFTGISPARQLELSTVTVPFGGTGKTTLTTGNVLIGQGISPIDTSKVAPNGVFVGDTDTQSLTNKTLNSATNTIVSDQIWDKIGAPVSIGNTPSALEHILKISSLSPNIATWQKQLSSQYPRIITVAFSSGDFTSIKDAVDSARTNIPALPARITGGVASFSAPIVIFVATGVYMEANPIVLGSGIILTSYTERAIKLSNVKVIPTTSTSTAVFQMASFTSIEGISVEGANGVGGIGIYSPPGTVDANITGCQITDCDVGYQITGPGTAYIQNNVAENVSATKICNIGFRITGGASVGSVICIARGDPITGTPMPIGFSCEGNDGVSRGSGMFGGSCSAILCLTSVQITSSAGIPATVSWSGSAILYSIVTGVDLYSDAIAEMYGTTITLSVGLDVRLRASTSKFIGAGNKVRADKIQFDNTSAQFIGAGLSDIAGNNAITIRGTLSVGHVLTGATTYIGNGDDYSQGMTVLQTNLAESSYTNITNVLKLNDGLTTVLFPTGAVGDKLYIGGQYKQFSGIGIKITTAMSPITEGTIVWEYWDGASWKQFRIMNASDSHIPYAQQVFNGVDEYHIRFDNNLIVPVAPLKSSSTFISSTSTWVTGTSAQNAWTQTTVNSVTAYWIRARVITLLTVNPVAEKLLLVADSAKINNDGYMEYFGKSRPLKKIQEVTTMIFNTIGVTNPSDDDVMISSILRIAQTQTRFPNSSTTRQGWVFAVPEDVDTSVPMQLEFKWTGNAVGTLAVEWVISWGYSRDYDVDSGVLSDVYSTATVGSAPVTAGTEKNIVFQQNSAFNKQVTSIVSIDVSNELGYNSQKLGDLMWVTIQRNGATDPYASTISLLQACLRYTSWADGRYIG